MSGADRAVRWSTVAAVVMVAAVAAWVSYRHCVAVVTGVGETGWVGRFYPVTIDGLIVGASMVLLDSARHRDRAPALAVWLLGAGISATLAVNVLAGVAHGTLGAVASAWPALAFVGCYELLMLLVRASARRSAPGAVPGPVPGAPEPAPDAPAVTNGAPAHITEAQRIFAGAIAAGEVPTVRKIRAEMGVGSHRAQQVRAHLAAVTGGADVRLQAH